MSRTYSKRLTELESLGLAERPTTKRCDVTGFECDAWDVTDRSTPLPVEPKKSKLHTDGVEERLASLEVRLRELDEIKARVSALDGRLL